MTEARLLGAAEALERHADEWRALAEHRGNAFISPEWFECWNRHYGDGGEVVVAVVGDGNEGLLGLIPFTVERAGRLRGARIAGANLADWMHPVADPDDESAVAAAAVAALARAARWGALVLDNVDARASWPDAPALAGARLRRIERSSTILPYARLKPGDFDDYLARRSGSFRRQLRRLDRRLAREGSIELRQVACESELSGALDVLFDLHFAHWATRGGSSLDSDRIRSFHREFAAAALARGWLRLLVLEADGEPIAAFYGWRLGDRYAFYQSGVAGGWSKFSVGLVLHGRVIERAIAEGAGEYDMLLGGESYKLRFCEEARDAVTVVLAKPFSAAGLTASADARARALVRRLPDGPRERVRRALGRFEGRLPTGRRR